MTDFQYFKRYRMEVDLEKGPLREANLPEGYTLVEWNPRDIERHALVKFRSFRDEMDAEVFTCLGEYYGCFRLMNEIAMQHSFLDATTWLIAYNGPSGAAEECGTIQGIRVNEELGSIQNVGIVPEHRGMGLGRALVLKSLAGFHSCGVRRVALEVTANNATAVGLYHSLGFRTTRTMYRRALIEEDRD